MLAEGGTVVWKAEAEASQEFLGVNGAQRVLQREEGSIRRFVFSKRQ